MGLNLHDFSCRTIWYAILATRGLWEVIRVIILSLQWWTCEHFWWFLQFCASQWYFRWLEWVSTFMIFPAKRFGMPYLPPEGLERWSESLFYHYIGVPVNIFGDFCNFVRPYGTLGGWNGSQPSRFFLPSGLVCNTWHQGALEGLQSKTPTLTTLKWLKITHFLKVICYFTAFWTSNMGLWGLGEIVCP